MPDIENSRKTAERAAKWVTVKQPKNSRKNSRNTRNTAVLIVSAAFPAVFGCFIGRWQQRLQNLKEEKGPIPKISAYPVSPYPQNLKFRGCHFTPKILGVECPKPLVLQCFLGAAP